MFTRNKHPHVYLREQLAIEMGVTDKAIRMSLYLLFLAEAQIYKFGFLIRGDIHRPCKIGHVPL